MNPRDPNVAMVEMVAKALGALRERVVLVGGCAVGLLITDDARPIVRPTKDVDVFAEITTHAAYYELSEDLRRVGFAEDSSGSVVCRWKLGNILLDVMPTDGNILGFKNQWALAAIRTATATKLPGGNIIQLVTPPVLVATKLEAFHDRGGGDYRASHDIEDIVNLVDGRSEIVEEIQICDSEVRQYLREEIEDLMGEPNFIDALPGHFGPSEIEHERVGPLIERLRRIAGI